MKTFKRYLKEYNKGGGSIPMQLNQLSNFLKSSIQIRTHIVSEMDPGLPLEVLIFRYDFDSKNQIYILKNRNSDEICGYCTLRLIVRDIWQIQETTIFDKYQGKRLATELYQRMILVDKKKLINGDQLSLNAEKLWNALRRDGRCKKIYNRRIDKIYDLSDIGKEINGIKVIAPEEDSKLNFKDIEFFYLAESKEELKEYYNSEYSTIDEDANYWCWLRTTAKDMSMKTMIIPFGHRTTWLSEEGDL